MLRVALICFIVSLGFCAEESIHPLIEDFFNSVQSDKQKEYSKYIYTPIQKAGFEYLTNPAKMYVGNAPESTDPHTKSGITYKSTTIPHWAKAVESFYQSAKKENNIISAYAGVSIIKTYLGKNNKDYMPQYKEMVEQLSKAKICSGQIEHASLLEQGYLMPSNVKKAYDVILEAKTNCQGIKNTWQKTALEISLSRLEKQANAQHAK